MEEPDLHHCVIGGETESWKGWKLAPGQSLT